MSMSVPPKPNRILVIGLGELGHEVAKSLANHPQRGNAEIAILLRSKKPEYLHLIKQWNCEFIIGDVVQDSQASLATTFRDFSTVICCTGMYAPGSVQVKIGHAVLQAGVKRYFPWQFGIDYDVIGKGSSQDLFDSQLDVRALLRAQQETKWVIVSTGMFISFLFEDAFGLVSADRRTVVGIGDSWENAITVTAPRDIGRVVAEIVFGEEGKRAEGVVYCAGDTVSMRGLVDVVGKVKGWEVERTLKTVAELKKELAEQPDDAMRKYRVVFAEGRGVAWSKEKSFNGQIGMEMQSVESWAKENL